ncbi:disease resistance protein At4g27190-like [Camellia sinensis]|uniref:disease resistance protein At4g27190-like n=1 Tax=Camellia sinensis TaxID=4442 RepID=UPI0010359A89|nr:disease resistance protein At4g27190-like [Camellia sinensis]
MNENRQCFKFSCPDYISHYRMSKEAENKIEEVKNLTQRGNFSKVANPKPFAQELQFPSSSANYANFESRKSVFENIMAALQDSNVKMIGVYGTGGVGKTTMVEEIGKQVKNVLFDEVVVAVVSQDANVSNIQGQLADRLSLKLKGETEVGKANELWNRLNNGKKNLIILDDMWQELNLKTIGIPITNGNNCCKVVITSRIRGVLEKMEVDRYFPMQVLLEKEAWALFKKKVGNFVDSPELHDIADAVCKECGGLPVAILAVGAALTDKKKYVWEDVLDQFKDSMLKNIAGIEPKVYASLKLSYDRLESSDAKSCFLLCCFFPEDANISIEVLARHCIARSLLGQNTNTLRRASRRVLTVVDILKDACLLLEGEDENFVKMHDVIRDVALSIAKDDGKEILVKHGDKKWPEKDTCESSSAMSLRFDNTLELPKLPDDLVCPQLHTLTIVLEWDWRSDALLNVPDRFFSGMEKLTILELNRICMLPPLSLANLVNLRMLWLEDCELGDIAILKDLNNNLEILSLRGSNIEVLPSEIGQLTRLRLLDLGNCKKLREIPQCVISNLSRLEELYILDDLKPWEVTRGNKERSKVNLDELGKLTQLTTLQIHIPNVMLLPKDFCFENLIRFKIEMGKEFDFSGTNDSFRTYSKSCKLAGVSLMDKLIVLLMRAEQLHLQKIEGLQEVLHDRGGEGSLMERHGLNPSGFFNNLIELTIKDCRLEYLFSLSCARGFPRLQRLRIFDCEMMEAIVGIEEEKDEDELSSQVINFSQLKYLRLENLPKLISFYPKVEKMSTSEGNSSTQAQFLFNEKVAFPALENLVIGKLPNIIEIWEKRLLIASENESKSCRLKVLLVYNCEKLVHVVRFNMLPRLQNLERFEVDNCPKMEAIVAEKEKETGTTSNDIIVFSQLTTISLFELVSLKSFYNWPTRFEAQPLFNHQVAFPVLENLVILKLPNIIEIWEKRLLIASENESKSCRLKVLLVYNCEKLVHVVRFNMLPRLQNLERFEVDNCPKMETIVAEKEKETGTTSNDIIVFSQLTTLRLSELVSLKSFYNWPTRFEAQPLFNHQVAFPVLENLVISKLPNIIEIWEKRLLITSENESKSCRLEDLEVSNCKKLVYVVRFNMLPRLQNLERFKVNNCPEMEAIVAVKEIETGTTSNDIIVFSQLATLRLSELVSLKSFYNWPTRFEAQPLFNHQVSFPKLKTLVLDNCVNSREIHPWNLQASKISLKFLDVANLDKLIVRNCSEVAEVFQLEGLNVGEGQHVRPLIEVRMMELDGLPQLTCLWNKDPHGILGLQSLQYLTIKKCSLLRNLFTCSTAMALQQLKVLYLESCPVMEEVIVATEDGLKEVIDVIEFPKLEWLILKDLPNLNSFCNANYNFNLPSLNRVVLKRCPDMHNFTLGQVRMSQIFVSTRGNEGLWTEDLNKYLEERLLKGEECATVDESDFDIEEEDFSNLYRLRWLDMIEFKLLRLEYAGLPSYSQWQTYCFFQ